MPPIKNLKVRIVQLEAVPRNQTTTNSRRPLRAAHAKLVIRGKPTTPNLQIQTP